jgi:hypothetical protein
MKAGIFSLLVILGLIAGCTTPPKPMASDHGQAPLYSSQDRT